MTRIIAGELGGRSLAVPPKGTRPTTDRVREALFSRLDHDDVLRGARVLDLFAGSGALGFEALSRGASHVTMVDIASAAVAVMKRNASTLDVESQISIVKERAHLFLAHATGGPWDVALIDPPYDSDPTLRDAVVTALAPHLADGAVVVVEASSRTAAPVWPVGLESVVKKKYGETTLHYARRDARYP